MNDVLKRIKALKLSKKNTALLIIAALGVALLLLSELLPSRESDDSLNVNGATAISAQKYTELTEKKLEKLISSIDGAGSVKVMITLESCYENVYAKSNKVSEETDEKGKKAELDEEYITVKNGTGKENCLIVKVYEPVIKGVAVISEGAGNTAVKRAITDTVSAVFDISSTAVSVEKMTNTMEEQK